MDVDLLRRGCGLLLLGLAVNVVDLRVDGIDLVHDVVGGVLLVVGASRLAGVVDPARRTGLSLSVLVVPAIAVNEFIDLGPAVLVFHLVMLGFWLVVAAAMASLPWPATADAARVGQRWRSHVRVTVVCEGGAAALEVAAWALAPTADGGTDGVGPLVLVAAVAVLFLLVHRVLVLVDTRRWARDAVRAEVVLGPRGA